MLNPTDWRRRVAVSMVYAIPLIVTSSLLVLSAGWNSTMEGFTVAALPLVPGWVIVSLTFGHWHAVQEAQVALIPLISLVVDGLVIFLVWEFIHLSTRRKSL